MEFKVTLTTEEIVRGDIAPSEGLKANPEVFRRHAEARREVYAKLAEVAEREGPEAAVAYALELYRSLPFVTGTPEDQYPEIKGQENALENFFLMIGLDPKVRREARKARKPLQ